MSRQYVGDGEGRAERIRTTESDMSGFTSVSTSLLHESIKLPGSCYSISLSIKCGMALHPLPGCCDDTKCSKGMDVKFHGTQQRSRDVNFPCLLEPSCCLPPNLVLHGCPWCPCAMIFLVSPFSFFSSVLSFYYLLSPGFLTSFFYSAFHFLQP